MMLVTSLAMVAEIIGDDKKSSGFVYGVCALMDKASLGFIVLGLQEYYPETQGICGEPCAQYLRGAFSVFPGIEALLAFLIVALLYRKPPTNIKRRMTVLAKDVYTDDIDLEQLPYLKATEV